MAALKNGGIEGSADWLTTICRPGPSPLESLADALAKTDGVNLGQGLAANLLEQLKDALRARHNTLHLTARASLGDAQPARRLVVLVDQFEELFTVCRDDAERQAFIGNLLYAARVTQGQTIILLTMRADFYGKCASYSELSAAISEHQFLVGPLTADELREAIERPAQLAGCEFEPGLVELLVEEVQRQPARCRYCSTACCECGPRAPAAGSRPPIIAPSGNWKGSSRSGRKKSSRRSRRRNRKLCRQLFLRLTEPGEGAEDTKRRVPWHELTSSQSDASGMADIVKSLADERLLTTSGSMPPPMRGGSRPRNLDSPLAATARLDRRQPRRSADAPPTDRSGHRMGRQSGGSQPTRCGLAVPGHSAGRGQRLGGKAPPGVEPIRTRVPGSQYAFAGGRTRTRTEECPAAADAGPHCFRRRRGGHHQLRHCRLAMEASTEQLRSADRGPRGGGGGGPRRPVADTGRESKTVSSGA